MVQLGLLLLLGTLLSALMSILVTMLAALFQTIALVFAVAGGIVMLLIFVAPEDKIPK